MKYIITESQRNRIFENTIEKKRNWVPILTSLVEKTCEQIELSCSEIDANDFPVGVNFDICEDTIQIRIYSNSPSFRNFDSLLYELSDRFTKTLGSNVNWKVLDQINHYDNLKR